jgi:hypothetical protein
MRLARTALFVVAASGLAGASAEAAAPADDPMAACKDVFVVVDYDKPDRLGGGELSVQEAAATRVRATTKRRRGGKTSVRSEARQSDPEVAGGPRAETQLSGHGQSRYRKGDVVFYGFSVFLPPGWVDDGGEEDIVFQWHNIPDRGEAHKSPNVFLAVKRDELVLRITSDKKKISTPESVLKEQLLLVDGIDLAKGGWHDLMFRIAWSTGKAGDIKVAYRGPGDDDYRTVAHHEGPNMHEDDAPGYLKWGIYKPAWRDGPTKVQQRVVFHDEIRVGRSWKAIRVGSKCP